MSLLNPRSKSQLDRTISFRGTISRVYFYVTVTLALVLNVIFQGWNLPRIEHFHRGLNLTMVCPLLPRYDILILNINYYCFFSFLLISAIHFVLLI